MNAEGLPVFGQYNATESIPECNYQEFLKLKAHTESLVYSLSLFPRGYHFNKLIQIYRSAM